jgi:hypothetical protein
MSTQSLMSRFRLDFEGRSRLARERTPKPSKARTIREPAQLRGNYDGHKNHRPESSVSEWKRQKIPLSITQTVVAKSCIWWQDLSATEASAKRILTD